MYPIKIISVEKSRELENQANAQGMSFAEMMENAGRATAIAIQRRTGAKKNRIIILVGPGNNGGDGLVAAHCLNEMGARVKCYVWKRSQESDPNLQRVQEDGIPVLRAEEDADFASLRSLVSRADVVVDALLGVGISLPIRGDLRDLLDIVRQALIADDEQDPLAATRPSAESQPAAAVVAVDCPTGLDCDSGALDHAAIPADMTVTYAYPKTGLYRFPGAEAVGDVVVADIDIPPSLAEDVPVELAMPGTIRDWLPERPHSAHKGTFGRALIVAGSVNYVGAAVLAGGGATRVGAGLVTMALPMPIQPPVAAQLAEATYLLLPHDLGVIDSGAVGVLQDSLDDYDTLLLGPGLTQEEPTVAFVHRLFGLEQAGRQGHMGFVAHSAPQEPEHTDMPALVVDADGLNALAQAKEWWRALPPETILTPHPGEMARLIGDTVSGKEIQADREGVASRQAGMWDTVVVLKGAFTVVASPDGRVVVVPFANAGLATAGSGDVLAGAITGLRAQGMGAFEAAVAGAYLHGMAGELVREELGDMGMVASDLLHRLPLALRRIRRRQA